MQKRSLVSFTMTKACSIEAKRTIKNALENLMRTINSKEISSAAKTSVRGFTQPRKITLQDVILFYTFRHCETTNKDITSYFSKTEKPKVSKQAMFKALNKTNPNVFPLLIHEFAENFYETQEYTTLDGWIVLASDGTKMDLPPSEELKESFGGPLNHKITERSKLKKAQANCSILVDVLNHVVLDAAVKPYDVSELPMLYEHLNNCRELLKDKKVMLICDRYYASAELFLYCKIHGYRLLVRSKSYVYKHQISKIERDGKIQLVIDQAWRRRLKREECRNYAVTDPLLDLRVVKNHYEYTLTERVEHTEPLNVKAIYLTTLTPEEFKTDEIISLYHVRRWDAETAYFDLKSHLEAERFNSGKYNIVVNELYGKILCYSICGLIYNKVNEIVLEKRTESVSSGNKYDYIPNMKYLCDTVRLEHKFLYYLADIQTWSEEMEQYLTSMINICSKNTVPVRPGRHYKRWERWMSTIPNVKFRIDGRRNPTIQKCFKGGGYITADH
ncbi:MAG: IS4 family transposase [Lachnospiraceae bacterium]|nr:IS4 family transposase [Lachnospiraceae bacterium]